VTASVILGEEVDPTLGIVAAGLTVLVAAANFVCGHYEFCPRAGSALRPKPGIDTPLGTIGYVDRRKDTPWLGMRTPSRRC
jgi:hypothetical protein